MKKILITSTILLCSVAAAQDFQQYISIKGTVGRMENKLDGNAVYLNKASLSNPIDKKKSDTVGGFSAAYGLIFPAGAHQIRGELEYGYNGKAKLNDDLFYKIGINNSAGFAGENSDYSSTVKSQFIMTNVYYDLTNSSNFTPYIGAGIGYARLKANNSTSFRGMTEYFSDSSNNFIWNISAGASYNINTNLAIDASYRFTDYGKVKTNHNFNIGQQYNHQIDTRSKVRGNTFNLGIRYTF